MYKKQILTEKEIEVMLHRLACELIENHNDFCNTVFIGIQPRGTYLAKRLLALLTTHYGIKNIPFGLLDITFFRVVFIDDVLYTGRSIRAALTALQSFGRPSEVALLVLIDRRFSRHLPIQPDYTGKQVDAINEERVVVHWQENAGEDAVYIERKKDETL